jgi:hypothetical protein
LAKFNGASGLVIITAPFPGFESSESPKLLLAVTIAKMLDPQGNEKGGACRAETGMLQEVELKTY